MKKKLAVPLLIAGAMSLCACQDGGRNSAPEAKQSASEAKATAPAVNPTPGPRLSDLEIRQNAYKAWKRGYDSNISEFDKYWKTWRSVFKSFTNGTGDRFSAYSRLKELATDMDGFRQSISEIKPPGELTDSQRKSLEEAYVGLRLATGKRVEAIQAAMEMIDSGEIKPSGTANIQSAIKESDGFLLVSLAKALGVESELNLLEPAEKHKKQAKKL